MRSAPHKPERQGVCRQQAVASNTLDKAARTRVPADVSCSNGGGARTRATYRLEVELEGFVPRSVTQILVERTLPATLEAFKKEAERRGA